MKRLTTTALLLGLVPASAFAAAHATLRPGTNLAVGSPAQLSITVDGDSRPPAAPHVAGASLRLSGQMSQTQIINGQTTQQMTYVYTLVPMQTGPLDIPAITVATSTGEATTEPVHANVTDAPAAAQPAAAAAPTTFSVRSSMNKIRSGRRLRISNARWKNAASGLRNPR